MQCAPLAQRSVQGCILQVKPALSSAFFSGTKVKLQCFSTRIIKPTVAAVRAAAAAETETEERFRLNNLSPQPGSRKNKTRKGRGYGAGQGGSCGFGMRGQKSRSGSGIRPGFEGGQTPLYRRLPKLRGIAGGMGAGLPDHIVINLNELTAFGEGEEVSIETLQEKRIINLTGRDARLPLKILGAGELHAPLTIKAAQFSASATEKIAAAGGKVVPVPQKPKWTRKAHERRVKAESEKAEKK